MERRGYLEGRHYYSAPIISSLSRTILLELLYSDVLDGLSELDFDSDLFRICDPSLVSFFDDADWYLAALHSMGHGDIADEFKDLNDKVRKYVKNNYGKMPHDELKTRILGMLPQKYICKKN